MSLFYFEDNVMMLPDESVHSLLHQTLQRSLSREVQISHINSVQLRGGMSGSAVWRHSIQYKTASASGTTALIIKDADLLEWRVLQHLQSQHQPNIPFAYAVNSSDDKRVMICMQDVGDQNRPTSLESISDSELASEAAGLAAIHTSNFLRNTQLEWLPIMSPRYVENMLFERTWRPAWEAAVGHSGFATTFQDAIPRVEAAAASIVTDMQTLLSEAASQTLIHGDINPSNVLVYNGHPYFIDWQTAMYGPFYIDLPHHHCTLTQAEHYRQALAAKGHTISRSEFAERYRVAARYIGLRYMWWTLEYWIEDPTQFPWVRHYMGLVTGDGIN